LSRVINSAVIAELAKDSFNMAHLVSIDFSTPVYLTENSTDLVYAGNTYTSSSALKGISNITETSEVQVGSVGITLSGVNQEFIAILLNQNYIDREVKIFMVVLNAANGIIGDPVLIYDGRVQSFTINDSETGSQILLTASSHWADFEKKSGRRTNTNSQALFFNQDKGFEFSPNTQKSLKWGRA